MRSQRRTHEVLRIVCEESRLYAKGKYIYLYISCLNELVRWLRIYHTYFKRLLFATSFKISIHPCICLRILITISF